MTGKIDVMRIEGTGLFSGVRRTRKKQKVEKQDKKQQASRTKQRIEDIMLEHGGPEQFKPDAETDQLTDASLKASLIRSADAFRSTICGR